MLSREYKMLYQSWVQWRCLLRHFFLWFKGWALNGILHDDEHVGDDCTGQLNMWYANGFVSHYHGKISNLEARQSELWRYRGKQLGGDFEQAHRTYPRQMLVDFDDEHIHLDMTKKKYWRLLDSMNRDGSSCWRILPSARAIHRRVWLCWVRPPDQKPVEAINCWLNYTVMWNDE